ncbi:unnamed protein product [Spirodela intermedia]|uniref:Uncharacterized protein n=1 Tax=Spirodela intermedia TaxID=51605 RepID=A0A7I8I8N4_SPIIN|nr:unnamed protein product [Spirodela intermedia]CAA6653844.1 unnamed protein product [Spirodela intermedia]
MMGKRREKLVEGLVGLQAMGGLDLAAMAGGKVECGKMIEVADILLARLDLLRAEEKEIKKRRKKEEKAAMKAAGEQCDESSGSEDDDDEQMKMKMTMKMKRKSEEKKMKKMNASCQKTKDCGESEDSSSSSSSESSDSDCEEEDLVDMKSLRSSAPADAPPATGEAKPVEKPEGRGATSTAAISLTRCSAAAAIGSPSVSACCSKNVDSPAAMDRIEVCMGGKCKRSGSMELMQEFQRRVGVEGAVVGCKCMGKCKEGPNVRVRSSTRRRRRRSSSSSGGIHGCQGCEAPSSLRRRRIQDVGAIVANFFSENKELDLAAA